MRSSLAAAVVLGIVLIPSPAHADPAHDWLTSAHNSVSAKSITIDCPVGLRVFGMGGRTNGGSGSVMLTQIAPDPAMTSVTASAHELPGFSGPWSVTVSVVCGPASLQPERIDAFGLGTAAADCPALKILYSSGFRLPEPRGVEYVNAVVPDQDLDGVSVRAGSIDGSPVAVAAVGVCAFPIADAQRVVETTDLDADTPKFAIAPKPFVGNQPGWMFGSGALVRAKGHVFIDGLSPLATLDGAWARAAAANLPAGPARMLAADPTTTEEWDMDVYGTCIGTWY